jgi:hypothetical protein
MIMRNFMIFHSYLIRIAVRRGSIATNIAAPKYISHKEFKAVPQYRMLIIYF